MNCKANTIIIIDCQPLQHYFSLVLLQISITLPTFPIPTLAKTHFSTFCATHFTIITTSFCTWSEVCSQWSSQRTETFFNHLAVAPQTTKRI